jgi:hypothetical protein
MSTSPVADSPLIVGAKKKAKHLQSLLKPQLPELTLGECLDYLSKLEHEHDWNTYCARLKGAGAEEKTRNPLDTYISDTALPLIMTTAAKHHMKVRVDSSGVQDSNGRYGRQPSRAVSMTIEPFFTRGGVAYCRPFFDVSLKSVRFGTGRFFLSLDFLFPEEAFPVVSRILSGNENSIGEEPQVMRTEVEQRPSYLLTVNASSVGEIARTELNIFNDSTVHQSLLKGLDDFFARYGRAVKAYAALQGKWGNKRLVAGFQSALWKMNSNEPPFMAAATLFYTTKIGGLEFKGEVTRSGPCIVGGDGSVAIGVCSIIYLHEGEEGKTEGYYIAKYSDKWQTELFLKGFGERDIDKITAEFGIPRLSVSATSFYQTPAFKGLCSWTEKNPQFAKRISRSSNIYLPEWYEQVMAQASECFKKPTKQDFLNALAKEPYLIDFGIWCSSHRDRKRTAKENKETFEGQRSSFSNGGFREFGVCCEWLKGCVRRKTVNASISSYTLKHMVEAWAKKSGRDDYYVSNGSFIAAAIHMGFAYKEDFDSPNVRFNISKKSPAIVALEGTRIG